VEGHPHAAALLRRVAAAAVVLALAGCGSGSKGLGASCDRQRAALARIGPVRSLDDAERAIGQVIAIERRAVADLRAANANRRLLASYRSALGDAERLQATLSAADPTQTMSPLQMGPSAGRRTLERAQRLAARACR
jgi:hypothetical protein